MKKEDIKDIVGATIKGAASLVPGGGFLTEYYDLAKNKILNKRFQEWKLLVDDRLSKMHDDIENLASDEFFFSCFQMATENAAKAHQNEKMKLFANALFNTLQFPGLPEDKKMFFIGLLDKYTLNTIKLLRLFSEDYMPQQPQQTSGMVRITEIGGTEYPVKYILEALPEYKGDEGYIQSMATQLTNDGLIHSIDWRIPVSKECAREKKTTKLGDDFIRFISQESLVTEEG